MASWHHVLGAIFGVLLLYIGLYLNVIPSVVPVTNRLDLTNGIQRRAPSKFPSAAAYALKLHGGGG